MFLILCWPEVKIFPSYYQILIILIQIKYFYVKPIIFWRLLFTFFIRLAIKIMIMFADKNENSILQKFILF